MGKNPPTFDANASVNIIVWRYNAARESKPQQSPFSATGNVTNLSVRAHLLLFRGSLKGNGDS